MGGRLTLKNWIDEIAIDDLPEEYKMIAEIIGLENTLKLAEHVGGLQFYFRKLDAFIARKKKEYILKNFNGNNHMELAKATNYSLQWVYQILKNGRNKNEELSQENTLF